MHNIKNFNFNDHCRKLKVHIVRNILLLPQVYRYCRSCVLKYRGDFSHFKGVGIEVYVGVYFTISSDLTIAHKLAIYVAWFSSFK